MVEALVIGLIQTGHLVLIHSLPLNFALISLWCGTCIEVILQGYVSLNENLGNVTWKCLCPQKRQFLFSVVILAVSWDAQSNFRHLGTCSSLRFFILLPLWFLSLSFESDIKRLLKLMEVLHAVCICYQADLFKTTLNELLKMLSKYANVQKM